MKVTIPAVKGTRDFYPELMQVRKWLYQKIQSISELYGYQEYEAPFIERIDLYAAKSGEELVKEQAFVFPDRGGDLITLRPELTPSLARMVAQKQTELNYPLRWWSYGPFWRYERPQKGRTRELFQWNIDLIGSNSPASDAELISICAAFFEAVGLTPSQVCIRVNDRGLMESEMRRIEVPPEQKRDVFRLIDRVNKLPEDAWRQYGIQLGLSQSQIGGLLDILHDKMLWQQSPNLVEIFEILEIENYRDWVEFDPRIVRGLDYYTGVVFEGMERTGGRSVLGGGHYDNLVADVGGEPLAGVGFAMGDVMTMIVLESHNLLPNVRPNSDTVLVTIFDKNCQRESIRFSNQLRAAGIRVLCYPEAVKLQKQLRFADKSGVRYVIIMGPEEIAKGQFAIKDLELSTQTMIDKIAAASEIKRILAQES
ncbi:MAG: histidine--tRNA ligase [Anaerolineae bacterium]|nr:histidine--tRNA ligase [Anaerolineae bacterium]